jgi:hypothetical protein
VRPFREPITGIETVDVLEGALSDADTGDAPLPLVRDLLLEERVQHDGRAPGILEALDVVEDVAHRRRAGHERMRQTKPEIRRLDVHAACCRYAWVADRSLRSR